MNIPQDSVENSKLLHRFNGGYTIHYIPDEKSNEIIRTEEWSRVKLIGHGGQGRVWCEVLRNRETSKAGLPANKQYRAVKEIPKTELSDQLLKRELKAIVHFSQAKYRNLFVESYGWFETNSAVFIAMEYLKHGDLSSYLVDPLPILEAKKIAVQILEGLYHMHKQGFAHRDLKPLNLLVVTTQPWHVKIADFGLCKQVLGDSTAHRTDIGTTLWKAPEYGSLNDPKVKLTPAVDIWSFGAIVFNMLTGKRPFLTAVDIDAYKDGRNNLLEEDLDSDKVGSECVDFLKRTMAPEPEDRLGAYACLRHPWLKAYRESSYSLAPAETTSSSTTSPNSPRNLTKFSHGNTSEVRYDNNDSVPSGTWDATELSMRNTTNGALKSSTLPSSPESYEAIGRDTNRTALPPKGSNAPISSTERSPARHPDNLSYNPRTSNTTQRMNSASSETRSSLRDKAAMLYHKGRWDDLANQMHTLIEMIGSNDPEYSECLGIMGLALLFCSGQEKRAEGILRRAKEFSKEKRHAGLNYLLARAYIRQNKHDQGGAQLLQASRDLWRESDADQELTFEEGYHLGVILLEDSRTKSEGLELLKNVRGECFAKLPQHPVGLKASDALNSLRA